MKMILFHGRDEPDETLDDWGYDFPVIHGVKSVHETYRSIFIVQFHSSVEAIDAAMLTGWDQWDETTLEIFTEGDLIAAGGGYFGDWQLVEDHDPVGVITQNDGAPSITMKRRYEVHHFTLCDGWVNTWQEHDEPMSFSNAEEAQAELDDFLKHIELEVERGERAADDGYDPSDFRIYDRLTDKYIH